MVPDFRMPFADHVSGHPCGKSWPTQFSHFLELHKNIVLIKIMCFLLKVARTNDVSSGSTASAFYNLSGYLQETTESSTTVSFIFAESVQSILFCLIVSKKRPKL